MDCTYFSDRLLGHWGYAALFVVVVLGNVGVPLPEETVLALAGYLVWRGDMRLPVVLVVGVVSAVAGDNLGYWVGRRFGRNALPRYARWVLGHPERLSTMADFIARRGPFGCSPPALFPASGSWPARSRAGSGCASRDSS